MADVRPSEYLVLVLVEENLDKKAELIANIFVDFHKINFKAFIYPLPKFLIIGRKMNKYLFLRAPLRYQ